MNFFNFNLKKAITFIILFSLPLVTINMEQKQFETFWFSKPFSWLTSLIQEGFYDFSTGVKSTTGMYLNLINIKKENQLLKNKNEEMMTRLLALNEFQIENTRLKSLLDFKASTKIDLISAQVIGRDLVADHRTITINKGLKHGLKSGMAVMTTQGALGYIFRPETLTSSVMLINDRYAVVDALIQRTRARGIVEGSSSGGCVLKYVERSEDVKPGDLVVTGGLDNIFPKGFPIAIVESTEKKNYSVSLKIDLKPIVDPYRVEEVFVINNAANEDMTERYTMKGTN
ncbi:MAG: rod shape-determining protein MreC [Bdellovibrionota bacterium]